MHLSSVALGLAALVGHAGALPQSGSSISAPPLCTSQSSPNPIAAQYPSNATGTINGTIIVVPIPYTTARSIIPSQYPILTKAYQGLCPSLPKDQYPMFLEGVLDHDIRSNGVNAVPDFTRLSFSFPFVDRLNDGSTSFRAGLPLQVSVNPVAIAGAELYSPSDVYPGTFDPPCEGYAFAPGTGGRRQRSWTGANQVLGKAPSWDVEFVDVGSQPYPLALYVSPRIPPAAVHEKLTGSDAAWATSRTSRRSARRRSSATTTLNTSTRASPRAPSRRCRSALRSRCNRPSSQRRKRSMTRMVCASTARSWRTTRWRARA